MRTEQKIFNDLIENIVNNSENNEAKITNVELWAKSWKEEMKQALTLTDVMRSDCEIEEIVEQNKDYVLGFYTGNELKEYLSNNYA
jgi:uncharacterized protein Yka (UPF0111/DUF47 family)